MALRAPQLFRIPVILPLTVHQRGQSLLNPLFVKKDSSDFQMVKKIPFDGSHAEGRPPFFQRGRKIYDTGLKERGRFNF
jgi:hypothetical protein